MNEHGKQYLFNEDSVRLFFLSPYARVRQIEDKIFLMGQGSDKVVMLPVKKGKALDIIEMLKNGAEEEYLKKMLSDILDKESEEWIHACIWEGIIE